MTATLLPPGRTARAAPTIAVVAIGLSVAAGAALLWGISLGYSEIDIWGAFLVPAVLCAVTIPVIRRIESRRADGLADLFTVALLAKMIAGYVRFLVGHQILGSDDSSLYHTQGTALVDAYRAGERSLWEMLPRNTGTRFISELNGFVGLLTGRSMVASFMVFSWLGFIGLACFVAAARRAVPGLMLQRYATLTLFLPSVLFWSSALGKDAWMIFGLGLFALGAAQLYTGVISGTVPVVLGALATAMVRPHLTAIALASLAVGFLGKRASGRRSVSPATIFLGFAAVAAMAAVTSPILSELLPKSNQGLSAVLDATTVQTSIGGSEIEVAAPNSLLDYPFAFVTVLFRPALFEVRSATQLISALEGTLLMVMAVIWRRNISTAVRATTQVPYLRFAAVYTLAFAFAWSSVGNLGIIARQRVQVLPLLLVFVCVASASGLRRSTR